MKRSGSGAGSSGKPMPINSGVDAQARRQVAPGRSVSHDQRGTALPVAGRRSGWPRPGYSGAKPPQQESRQEVLPQAAEGLDVRAAGHHHRQAEKLWCGKREILPGVEHRQSRYLNNRCENSHRPTRQRERRMQGFKSPGHAQRFLSAYGPIAQHFRPRRHLLSASAYRQEMSHRFESWAEITGTERAA